MLVKERKSRDAECGKQASRAGRMQPESPTQPPTHHRRLLLSPTDSSATRHPSLCAEKDTHKRTYQELKRTLPTVTLSELGLPKVGAAKTMYVGRCGGGTPRPVRCQLWSQPSGSHTSTPGPTRLRPSGAQHNTSGSSSSSRRPPLPSARRLAHAHSPQRTGSLSAPHKPPSPVLAAQELAARHTRCTTFHH